MAAVNAATEDAFPFGADVRVLDPAAGKGAEAAQQEASEAAQVRYFFSFFPLASNYTHPPIPCSHALRHNCGHSNEIFWLERAWAFDTTSQTVYFCC